MATRARIAFINNTNYARIIEVAYEGYPAYTGAILNAKYNTPETIQALMKKGNIMALEENIDDIKSDEVITQTRQFRFGGNVNELAQDSRADYIYVYKEGDNRWLILSEGQLTRCLH